MKKFGLILIVCLFIVGCSTSPQIKTYYPHRNVLFSPWNPKDVFIAIEQTRPVENGNFGLITVRRESDGSVFNVCVIPFKNIRLGEQVKIFEFSYHPNILYQHSFCIVR